MSSSVSWLCRVHPFLLLGLGLKDTVLLGLVIIVGALGPVFLFIGVLCGWVHP